MQDVRGDRVGIRVTNRSLMCEDDYELMTGEVPLREFGNEGFSQEIKNSNFLADIHYRPKT
jgi:hypothetical protein